MKSYSLQAKSFKLATYVFMGSMFSHPVAAEDAFWGALSGGKLDFSARYRFEHVDDDLLSGTGAPLKDAKASTIRTTLGYSTAEFYNFSGRLALQDVRTVGSDDFNDATGNPGAKTAYAVVADPSDTDVLEGFLSFSGIPDTVAKIGRQQITYRDAPFHRYIGNILWRQNWQTFDAFSIQNTALPDTTVSYAYTWNINRIFSDEAVEPKNNFDSDSHFVNIKYNKFPYAKLEAYAYLLDFENAAAFSTNTFGGRISGAYPVTDKFKVIYTAEYADQSDAADNPANIDASYYLGEVGVNFPMNGPLESVTLKFSYELLEGEGGANRFVTILGTNHAYQGWADRFLITPGDGIEDYYVTLIAKIMGAKFIVSYHDINSDNLSYDYGEELDLLLTKTFKQHYTVGVKYSAFSADRNATNIANNGANNAVTRDVNKFWVWTEIKF